MLWIGSEKAIRFLAAQHRLHRLAEARGTGTEVERLRTMVADVRTTIGKTSQIKRHASSIQKSLDQLLTDATGMEREIKRVLGQMEAELLN